jgi:hypothetical protein
VPDPEPAVAKPTEVAASPSAEAEALPDSVLDPLAVSAGTEEASPESASAEPYAAQRGGKLFHARTCSWLRRVSEADRLYFKRVAEAREQGLAGCPVCDPWEPA